MVERLGVERPLVDRTPERDPHVVSPPGNRPGRLAVEMASEGGDQRVAAPAIDRQRAGEQLAVVVLGSRRIDGGGQPARCVAARPRLSGPPRSSGAGAAGPSRAARRLTRALRAPATATGTRPNSGHYA